MESIITPFTLSVDWLAFTVPHAFAYEVMDAVQGEWAQSSVGFRGYPDCWMTTDGFRGVGKMGTGAPRSPREVHVDLSGGIVSAWEIPHLQAVLAWVIAMKGHFTRIDCALDDRAASVPVSQIQAAIDAGQMVTRATNVDTHASSSADTGESRGTALYIGSPASQTRLRIYDKRLELQQKHRPNWADFGTRWELEFRKDRADACARRLAESDPLLWQELVVGLLRSHLDFRETTRDHDSAARCRAPLVAWWEQLTCGFQKARLTVEKRERTLDEVKEWFKQSVGPTLAVLYVIPGLGLPWIEEVVNSGADRWKKKHHLLLKGTWRKPAQNEE